MCGKAILRSYRDSRDKKALLEYGEMLERKGWLYIPMEGGYLSPDGSTMFIVARAPYYGELLSFSEYKEQKYLALVWELIASGDFIE